MAQQVGKTLIQGESTPDWIEQLSGGKHSVLWPDSEPDRIRLDVRQVNLRQLQQLGVHGEQVAIAPYCTYQNQHRFFSYRRDRLKSVQWSGILTSMKN